MKNKLIFVSLFLLFSFQNTYCKNDLIKQVVSNILQTVPELEIEIEQTNGRTPAVSRILGERISYFKQSAKIIEYEGVSDDYLKDFVRYLRNVLEIPQTFEADFEDSLMMIKYSGFNEVVVYRIVHSVGRSGKCQYVCLLAQRDKKKKETDWLIADIDAEFDLAPDLIIIEQSVSTAWSLVSVRRQIVVHQPKSINEYEITTLINFFEILVFERFAVLLKISDGEHSTLKFLKH
jgi:hypothetical protein